MEVEFVHKTDALCFLQWQRLFSCLPDNCPSVCTVCLCLHKTCRTRMHTRPLRELKSFPLPVYTFIHYSLYPPVLLHAHMCEIALHIQAHICQHTHIQQLTRQVSEGKRRLLIIQWIVCFILFFCCCCLHGANMFAVVISSKS